MENAIVCTIKSPEKGCVNRNTGNAWSEQNASAIIIITAEGVLANFVIQDVRRWFNSRKTFRQLIFTRMNYFLESNVQTALIVIDFDSGIGFYDGGVFEGVE